MRPRVLNMILGLVGAVLGAALGFFGFGWMLNSGFYAIVLPSALIGVGCGLLARTNSNVRGALCGVAGLLWGLFTEFYHMPFPDHGFDYFLAHLGDLDAPSKKLGLIGVGALISLWMGRGHLLGARGNSTSPSK